MNLNFWRFSLFIEKGDQNCDELIYENRILHRFCRIVGVRLFGVEQNLLLMRVAIIVFGRLMKIALEGT